MTSPARLQPVQAYVAVSERGCLAPFIGIALRRSDLRRAYCERYQRDLETAGYHVERVTVRAWAPPHTKKGEEGALSMSTQIPSIGRIVHYRLGEDDAQAINRRRTTSRSIRERLQQEPPTWPEGAQAHIGNHVAEGDVFPMLITRVWSSETVNPVNGQVFLDGDDVLWARDIEEGDGPGTFSWPPRT